MPNLCFRLLLSFSFCFWCFATGVFAQNKPDTVVYHSLENLAKEKVTKKKSEDFGIKFSLSSTAKVIDKFWRFQPGDSAQWKNRDYQDQHWPTFAEYAAKKSGRKTQLSKEEPSDDDEEDESKKNKKRRKKDPQLIEFERKWLFRKAYFKDIFPQHAVGWFRTNIKIPSSLVGKPLALELKQSGASEIYLDGKKLVEYGKVTGSALGEIRYNPHELPVPFSLMDTGLHVLAIRYSDHSPIQEGFMVSIDEMKESVNSYATYTKFVMGFPVALFGFFAALFLVHLLIYLFERTKTFNLFYSFFVGSMALIFLLPVVYFNVHNPDVSEKIHFYSDFILPVYLITLISLLYVLFKDMRSKFYLFQVLMAVVIVVLIILENEYRSSLSGILALLVYIDSFRLSLKALNRKQEGARYVGAGVLGSTIFFIIGIFWLIFGAIYAGNNEGSGIIIILIGFFTLIALAIMSLPLSVTIFLAHDFSRTNRGLIKQIENVKELSKQNLIKEQEKQQILADQKSELEKQVAHRTAEVVEQNRIISIKNQEVKESLQYASRIQSAILPSLDKLRLSIPDCDCLLKPKEVVSGDFYFVHQFENKVLFAVIDCTGHGVPGALMSMIGSMMLNQIVAEREIDSPAQILIEMNRWINETLKQNLQGLGTQDGMDAAIAVFEPESRTLTFAGAMRPMYLLRNENSEPLLEEIKGTKKSIGGDHLDRKIHFSEIKLSLQKGDIIYLFSDGYADQFGGSLGKKLMLKNFKSHLLSLANLPLDKQILLLEERFEEWRGNHEQVDDVCVMGLRIP